MVLASTALAGVLGLFVLPLPYHTSSEGVLWLPERAILRAETGGFVREVLLPDGAPLKVGQAGIHALHHGLAGRGVAAHQQGVAHQAIVTDHGHFAGGTVAGQVHEGHHSGGGKIHV